MRPHFFTTSLLRAKAQGSYIPTVENAYMTAMWHPILRVWVCENQEASVHEAAKIEYAGPCYTAKELQHAADVVRANRDIESELKKARKSAFEYCADVCDSVGDRQLDDLESRGAYACAEEILREKDKI
jgi:hypothetical protein